MNEAMSISDAKRGYNHTFRRLGIYIIISLLTYSTNWSELLSNLTHPLIAL